MKLSNRLLAVGTVLLVFAFFSCDLQIPQSVRVKTNPTIQIPLGTKANLLKEAAKYDITEEIEKLTDPNDVDNYIEGLSMLDVKDGEPITLQLRKDIVDISINEFATEELNLDDTNQNIDPITFTVPAISFAGEDINENIDPIPITDGNIDLPSSLPALPLIEATAPATDYSWEINATGYTTVTFYQGSLIITPTLQNANSVVVRIHSATIMDGATTVVSAGITGYITAPTPIVFPLSGVALPSTFDVVLNIELVGDDTSDFNLIPGIDFSNDTEILSATGISIDQTNTGTIPIPLNTDANFVSAVIGAGSVDVTLDIPDAALSWSGVSNTITLRLYQGSTLLASGSDPDSISLNLAGVPLGAGNLSLEYEVHVSGDPSDFEVDPTAGVYEVTGSATAVITEFSTLVVTSDDMDFSQSFSQSIDDDVKDIIDIAVFDNPTITVTMDNNMPFDINVGIVSSQMRVDTDPLDTGTDLVYDANSASTFHVVPMLGAQGSYLENQLTISAFDTIDIEVSVTIPGYNAVTGELTMNNVLPGTDYSMSATVETNFDITSIYLGSVTQTDQFPSSGDPGLDFSALGDVLPEEVGFSDVTGALELDIHPSLQGTIDLEMWTDDYNDDNENDYLIGALDAGVTLGADDVPINGLDNVLNARPGDLYFHYKMTADGTQVTLGTDDQRISAALVVTIPLQIHVEEDPEQPYGAELLNEDKEPLFPAPDEDLFGRDGTDEDTQDMLEMMESIALHMDIENSIGIDITFVMLVPDPIDPDNNPPEFEKTFTLASGSQVIGFTEDEIAYMTAPNKDFMPEIHAYIPAGDYGINPGSDDAPADISITMMWLELRTEVDYSQSFGGDE